MFTTSMSIFKILITLVFACSPVCHGKCRGNKSLAETKKNIEESLRHCIAECMDLTGDFVKEKCLFDSISGRVKSCDAKLPIRKSKFKVICFMENNWDISSILSEKGQPLCDILVMPAAVFNKETNLLQMKTEHWSMASLALKSAKKSGMKVMLRVGSFGDSEMHPKELTRVAKNAQLTAKFVQGVVEFVSKYDFDGIAISWIWVGCPQGICTQDIDRKSVVSFLRALATPFKVTGKTVIYHMNGVFSNTIMVSGDYFSEIVDVIDYFYFECHLQTAGDWLPTTDFSFNLKKTRDLISELMTKIKKGSEFRRKLVLTIQPNYKNYELSDQKTLKIGTVFVKNSKMQKSLIMSEWCKLIKDPSYQLIKNASMQNYAVKANNLFIFDDQESLTAKVDFVMEIGAGVGMHDFTTDDVNGECGCGRMPFLRLIVNILKMDCEPISCF